MTAFHEGLAHGWEFTLAAIGGALGALPALAILTLLGFAVWYGIPALTHRARVWRLRREFVKAGRGTQAREVDRLAAQGYDAGQIASRIAARNR